MSSTSEGCAIPAKPGNTDDRPVSTPVSPANPPELELVPEPDTVPLLELTPPFFCFFRAALTASSSEDPPPTRFFFSFSLSFLRPSAKHTQNEALVFSNSTILERIVLLDFIHRLVSQKIEE
jgi:hypothetical protein